MSPVVEFRPIVLKIGGSTLGSEDTTLEDLAALHNRGSSFVVVHGGGKIITDWLQRSRIEPRFLRGLRVTDSLTLEVVIGVLAGLVNKQLVAALQAYGVKAMGLSGIDGPVLHADYLSPELGFVGRVVRVNPKPILDLLSLGYLPVIAPVAVRYAEEPEGSWALLNINADTAAGEIATAIEAEQLLFFTDTAGVMDESNSLVPRLSPHEAENFIASGVIAGGMIPKVEACLEALPHVGRCQVVDGRVPHALTDYLNGEELGTQVG